MSNYEETYDTVWSRWTEWHKKNSCLELCRSFMPKMVKKELTNINSHLSEDKIFFSVAGEKFTKSYPNISSRVPLDEDNMNTFLRLFDAKGSIQIFYDSEIEFIFWDDSHTNNIFRSERDCSDPCDGYDDLLDMQAEYLKSVGIDVQEIDIEDEDYIFSPQVVWDDVRGTVCSSLSREHVADLLKQNPHYGDAVAAYQNEEKLNSWLQTNSFESLTMSFSRSVAASAIEGIEINLKSEYIDFAWMGDDDASQEEHLNRSNLKRFLTLLGACAYWTLDFEGRMSSSTLRFFFNDPCQSSGFSCYCFTEELLDNLVSNYLEETVGLDDSDFILETIWGEFPDEMYKSQNESARICGEYFTPEKVVELLKINPHYAGTVFAKNTKEG